MVIAVMAVLSAIVAPSFFSAGASNAAKEARQLQKLLRLATEESQLAGLPIQLRVYQDGVNFFTQSSEGGWVLLQHDVLQYFYLAAPVVVSSASLDGGAGLNAWDDDIQNQELADEEKKAALARFILWPDGSLTAGFITLRTGEQGETSRLRLRSGPAGIRVMKKGVL